MDATITTDPTMSVEEAGSLLGVSRGTAYRAARSGQIPTIRVGRRLLVPRALLLKMLGLGESPAAADVPTAHV